ncbi:MAG TPA: exodeoxyribonuclease VII small subunit [Acidimicrobiales bacterium]
MADEHDAALETLTFEQLVDELERTIDQMAGGALGIEEVTDLYERAGRLHDAAAARLATVQERIDRLTGGSATRG